MGGHDVVIKSRGTDTPLPGDGGRIPAFVMHVADFTWNGYDTLVGSSPDLDFILNRDSLEWEFDLEQATVWINGTKVKDRGESVKQIPFDYFFVYFGGGAGDRGLFIVSNRSFEHAEPHDMFEWQRLRLEAGGNSVVVASEDEALLSDDGPIRAWVRHEPDFVWTRDGQAQRGVIMGVTSDLQTVL